MTTASAAPTPQPQHPVSTVRLERRRLLVDGVAADPDGRGGALLPAATARTGPTGSTSSSRPAATRSRATCRGSSTRPADGEVDLTGATSEYRDLVGLPRPGRRAGPAGHRPPRPVRDGRAEERGHPLPRLPRPPGRRTAGLGRASRPRPPPWTTSSRATSPTAERWYAAIMPVLAERQVAAGRTGRRGPARQRGRHAVVGHQHAPSSPTPSWRSSPPRPTRRSGRGGGDRALRRRPEGHRRAGTAWWRSGGTGGHRGPAAGGAPRARRPPPRPLRGLPAAAARGVAGARRRRRPVPGQPARHRRRPRPDVPDRHQPAVAGLRRGRRR